VTGDSELQLNIRTTLSSSPFATLLATGACVVLALRIAAYVVRMATGNTI
jgi:hypothetical protein